jgi:hypothetical protein
MAPLVFSITPDNPLTKRVETRASKPGASPVSHNLSRHHLSHRTMEQENEFN